MTFSKSDITSATTKMTTAMRTTEENIRQLLEMLDAPNAYTEQEIQDIINRDDETRDTYRLLVEAKRSRRHRQTDDSVDVDAAWQRFIQRLQPKQQGFGRMKAAASFIGVLLVSGIAFAAIHIVQQAQKQEVPQRETMESVTPSVTAVPADTLSKDTVTIQPVIYDNIPLEKMLPAIAAHYDAEVTFLSSEARELRFRFVWNPQEGLDQVVSDLNRFERLSVKLNDNQLIVE